MLFVVMMGMLAFVVNGCGGGDDSGPAYTLYGNNLTPEIYEGDRYIGGCEENVQATFNEDNWELIGTSSTTETFNSSVPYKDFFLTFGPGIKFDSIESIATGDSIGYDASGKYAGYYINSGNIFNEGETYGAPTNILGLPDGTYAVTINSSGYMLFRFAGWVDGTTPLTNQIKITVGSN
jgi:hypothetical protein